MAAAAFRAWEQFLTRIAKRGGKGERRDRRDRRGRGKLNKGGCAVVKEEYRYSENYSLDVMNHPEN